MSHKHALTLNGNGILPVLQSAVGVSLPFLGDPQAQKDLVIKNYQGVWDTGATGSVITEKVVKDLGLKPTGQKEVHTASETVVKNTYLVNIYLPMNVVIQTVSVTEGVLHGLDLLIGMDIITLGDFAITNLDGRTKMTFGIPSIYAYDYVEKVNESNNKILAKQRCNCGSGKKYIYCHGKDKK